MPVIVSTSQNDAEIIDKNMANSNSEGKKTHSSSQLSGPSNLPSPQNAAHFNGVSENKSRIDLDKDTHIAGPDMTNTNKNDDEIASVQEAQNTYKKKGVLSDSTTNVDTEIHITEEDNKTDSKTTVVHSDKGSSNAALHSANSSVYKAKKTDNTHESALDTIPEDRDQMEPTLELAVCGLVSPAPLRPEDLIENVHEEGPTTDQSSGMLDEETTMSQTKETSVEETTIDQSKGPKNAPQEDTGLKKEDCEKPETPLVDVQVSNMSHQARADPSCGEAQHGKPEQKDANKSDQEQVSVDDFTDRLSNYDQNRIKSDRLVEQSQTVRAPLKDKGAGRHQGPEETKRKATQRGATGPDLREGGEGQKASASSDLNSVGIVAPVSQLVGDKASVNNGSQQCSPQSNSKTKSISAQNGHLHTKKTHDTFEKERSVQSSMKSATVRTENSKGTVNSSNATPTIGRAANGTSAFIATPKTENGFRRNRAQSAKTVGSHRRNGSMGKISLSLENVTKDNLHYSYARDPACPGKDEGRSSSLKSSRTNINRFERPYTKVELSQALPKKSFFNCHDKRLKDAGIDTDDPRTKLKADRLKARLDRVSLEFSLLPNLIRGSVDAGKAEAKEHADHNSTSQAKSESVLGEQTAKVPENEGNKNNIHKEKVPENEGDKNNIHKEKVPENEGDQKNIHKEEKLEGGEKSGEKHAGAASSFARDQNGHTKRSKRPTSAKPEYVECKPLYYYLEYVKANKQEYTQHVRHSKPPPKEEPVKRLVKLGQIFEFRHRGCAEDPEPDDNEVFMAAKALRPRTADPARFGAKHDKNPNHRGHDSSLTLRQTRPLSEDKRQQDKGGSSSTPGGVSGANKDDEVPKTELEKRKVKAEDWSKTVSTSVLTKARVQTLREMGSEDKETSKWWEAFSRCRYLRQPDMNS